MEENRKIEMIGYNDARALAIYGIIKMFPVFIMSLIISLLSLIPTIIFQIYELAYIFIVPVFLLIIIILQYIVNSRYKTFLKDTKTKHNFVLENGVLYKNGIEIKSKDNIRLYKFKNFIFLELKKSYYRIMNDEYLNGSREELMSHVRFHSKHYISFTLSPKNDDDIVNLLFKEVTLEGKERLFYSQDRKKIIYIYKNSAGSYSIGYESMYIAFDEERYYLGKYGWWEPKCSNNASYFGTIDEAYKEIKIEVRDFIEMK